MFKHILVPLDGSRLAESALPATAFLAEKLNSRVTLIHVIEKNVPKEVHGQPHLRTAREAENYLQEIRHRWFAQDLILNCHVHTMEVDDVAQSIVQHAGEFDHDLLVMCSHGRGKTQQLLMGSIAQKIIGLGSIPVLMTHPVTCALPVFSCKRLLVPLDDDQDHGQALPVSKELARQLGSSLHLIMVVHCFKSLSGTMAVTSRLLPGTTSRLLELASRNAEVFVQQQLNELLDQGYTADAEVLRGDPAKVIDQSAQANKADIIVLATHGKSGMAGFWAGSVAHKLCSICRTPLLLIPVEEYSSENVKTQKKCESI